MVETLTQISIIFQLIKGYNYLHANNQVSIFCITNCEFRVWVGMKYIFQHSNSNFLLVTLNYSRNVLT